MANESQTSEDKVFMNRVLEAAIRIGLIVLLVTSCFLIIHPFIAPVLWGIVIAVGVYPLYQKVVVALGNSEKLAATFLTLFAIALLIIPTVLLMDSTVSGIQGLSKNLEEGTLTVPPPPENVATWPLIGKPLDDIWRLATGNVDADIKKTGPQLKTHTHTEKERYPQ